ncbi:MAG TPA: RNA polymerase sigma factor [bacterium]|nr:RNA polymerase sigma factor [bacterium]
MAIPDRDEFEAFVRGQQERMLRLCAGMLSDAAEAADVQDAAQEVFVKAYRAWGTFRGESSRATWLYRIAVRHCIDRLRSRARFRKIFSEPSGTQGLKEADYEAYASSADAAEAESRIAVRELLEALPEDDRAILVLREIEGLSYAEIARVLDKTVEAVRSKLARARQALARTWEKRLKEGS